MDLCSKQHIFVNADTVELHSVLHSCPDTFLCMQAITYDKISLDIFKAATTWQRFSSLPEHSKNGFRQSIGHCERIVIDSLNLSGTSQICIKTHTSHIQCCTRFFISTATEVSDYLRIIWLAGLINCPKQHS